MCGRLRAWRSRKNPGSGEHTRHGALELTGEPARRLDEALQRHSGLDATASEHVYKILGRDIACGRRSKRTSADSTDAGIEHGNAAFDGGMGVGETRVAGIVKMAPQP
jgi:hypothetical protein